MIGSLTGTSRAPGCDEQRAFIGFVSSSTLRECGVGYDHVLDYVGVRDVFESFVSRKLNICPHAWLCLPVGTCCDI